MTADVARQYAITCEDKKLYARAFDWWLSATLNYSNSSSDLFNVGLQAANDALEKVASKQESNILLERATKINNNLLELAKQHPVEADLLLSKFKNKLEIEDVAIPF